MDNDQQQKSVLNNKAQPDLDKKLKQIKRQGFLVLFCLALFWVLSLVIILLGPLGSETIALTIEMFWIAVGVGVISIISSIYLFKNTKQTVIASWDLPKWIQVTRYISLFMAISISFLLALCLLIFLLFAAAAQNDPGAFS